jgi:uncharacterized protein (DUF1499 family)
MKNSMHEILNEANKIQKMKRYFHINEDSQVLRYFKSLGFKLEDYSI